MFSLKGKTALVTGGQSGIGKAIVDLFVSRGASVYVLDLTTGKDDNRAEKGGKGTVISIPCNVAIQSEVESAINQVMKESDQLDIVVNNAGVSHIGTLEQTTENDLDKIYEINVKGMFQVAKAVIVHMKSKGGVILNMASVAASVGLADRFAYSTGKGAVVAMTLSIAKDYINYGIRCNCISPGRVHTPFVDDYIKRNYPGKEEEMFLKLSATQPIGRMAKPEEIAFLALYLASDEASFLTGCDYAIDGGFTRLNS
ncbi:SDR family NAD(P)-dependent oxidoreductase [Sphingobacterium sp. UT-1RO-CII-1]|uniref:SDR family NAD(P)-dependent oxidoreductase n=1 Tax=Sphingobacterium sp. UT-1RO-CII-1 TaxID=2995225 RepID=UPI00227D5488|nr:SDR family oxidoreductase [Sphingobacterium sp. UT-1RO-CII-1]MCY4778404.1 SDR family NAD(P)-dependent oxidoreductase [Sphingobacterium sp. UT-1RO-CII-1]